MKRTQIVTIIFLTFFSGLIAQEAKNLVEIQLLQNNEEGTLSVSDISFEITNEHKSTLSGIHHIYYRQVIDGIPVLGTASGLHIKKGEVYKKDSKFIGDIRSLIKGSTPSISPKKAIEQAMVSEQYKNSSAFVQISKNANDKKFLFSNGGISLSDIPVSLAYKVIGDKIYLIWDISIQEKTQKHWYNMQVDANTGDVISKFDWMSQCNLEHNHDTKLALDFNKNLKDIPNYEAKTIENQGCTECYEVFAIPLESPYSGPRTIESNSINNEGSPFGWHDTNGADGAEFTTTRGNNVNAYEDGDNPGYQPEGGATLDFTGFPFNEVYSDIDQSEDAAITNLFYWNNLIHDVLYPYGFDAKSGNFQENNYDQDGIGSDSVNAEAQDSSGECNANFGTPPDGENPRMQMYTCDVQDGDFDAIVIAHEYGHGVSIRLTGGAANVNCLFGNEQMGEGWSDYFGAMLTMTDSDLPEDPRAIGTYLFGQGLNGDGIRPFPYSTDLSVNPHTYNDIMTESIPHGVGSVWAEMLWEMTWNLINAHGFSDDFMTVTGDVNLDAGNIQALLLVTEGLKLQPCAPGFVDGRDAILAADVAIYGGINECLIWDAFAKRGLGFSADQGSSSSNFDGIEAFDTPSNFAEFSAPADLCESAFVLTNVTGGFPFGGFYSGPGVTDNGDGYSYTFDPAGAGPGAHTIVYEVQNGNCSIASSDSDTIGVFPAPDSPTTTGALLVCLNEEVTVTATLNDPENVISWYDAAIGGNFLGSGPSLTFVPSEETIVYAQEAPLLSEGELKVTELSLFAPDILEITNIGAAKDFTGYKVAISDVPFSDINAVNVVIRELGIISENSAIFFDDLPQSPNFWGENISWSANGHGWVIILDPDNNVVESVFWNATADEISTLDVLIDGVSIDASDIEWTGIGADFDESCNASFKRIGENNNASNWPPNCLDSDHGIYNAALSIFFQGCLPQRVPTLITGEEEAPTIICPDDMVITQSGGFFEMPDFTIAATASDNCSFIITQSPDIGSTLAAGAYNVLLTVTDPTGNTSTCEFELDAILGVDETAALDSSISLVPNPTFGNIELTYNGNVSLTTIQVIDINGRLIREVIPSVTDVTNFSLVDLASGLYFVRIVAGDSVLIRQVIKR